MSTPIAHALPLIVLCAGSDASQVGRVEGVEATPPAPEGARFRLRPLLLAVPNPHANPRDRPGTWNSQSGQDRTVHALMPSDGMGNRHRFFIDLAANEWRRNSNTRALERDYNWEGLCIEANPSLHASLLSQRNCTVVGAAVASTEEKVRFTPRGVYGGIVGKGMRNSKAHDEDVIEMRTVPFWRILEQTKAPKTIDYMSLDVEAQFTPRPHPQPHPCPHPFPNPFPLPVQNTPTHTRPKISGGGESCDVLVPMGHVLHLRAHRRKSQGGPRPGTRGARLRVAVQPRPFRRRDVALAEGPRVQARPAGACAGHPQLHSRPQQRQAGPEEVRVRAAAAPPAAGALIASDVAREEEAQVVHAALCVVARTRTYIHGLTSVRS